VLAGCGQVAVEPFGSLDRPVQHPLHGRIGAPSSADDDEEDDHGRHEGEALRADGYTDGDPRGAVAGKEHLPVPPVVRVAAGT
jgi:hypothetical protein